jgi:hypothetical protein
MAPNPSLPSVSVTVTFTVLFLFLSFLFFSFFLFSFSSHISSFHLNFNVYHTDIHGPTTQVGTGTDYSVGPWDYSTWVARHQMA